MNNKPKETVKKCDHSFVYVDDDCGGLCDGGSYEIYECEICGKRKRVQLPD